jgi:mono/diheme cytochrome c family protein
VPIVPSVDAIPNSVVARQSPQDSALTLRVTAPEVEPQRVFVEACGSCHVPTLIGNSHWESFDDYLQLVNRKIGMGASITREQAPELARYLFANFGSPPDPGKAIFESACGSCHALDVMNGHVYSDEAPYRTIVTNMVNYGAGVSGQQVDAFVAYLLRTYGKVAAR